MHTKQQELARKALELRGANQDAGASPLSFSEIVDLLSHQDAETRRRLLSFIVAEPEKPMPDRVLSFTECCEIIGCSKKHFHCVIKCQLPVVAVSTKMRGVRASDLDAWLKTKTREAS
jgi:predicted DNA-binding transcriptional regulator AlpA